MSEPSLAALAGHDPDAAAQFRILQDAYRVGGLPLLRKATEGLIQIAAPEALSLLLSEAVLTISEQTSRPTSGRRAWEHFEAEEARIEGDEIRRGGGA